MGKIVGNGPFRLGAWQRGECMVLARNPTYHGRFGGNVHRVELSTPQNPSAILEMYRADGLDIMDLAGLPVAERERARRHYAGDYMTAPELNTRYVGFNVTRPPFDDRRVRRAFALAVDKERLADVILKGYVAPATGGFLSPGMPGHSAGIGLPYDPEGARILLAEAGYPEGYGFPLVEGLFPGGWELAARYLQAQWRECLGVEVRGETLEWAAFLNELEDNPPPIIGNGWTADYPDPDNFLRASFVHPKSRWQTETYDKLVEEARRVMQQRERMRLYRQADKILVEEAAIAPLAHGRLHMLVKPWVRRFLTSPMEWWFLKDLIIEPH
jgi:oligopeptide transport system substrate-binding protein